MIIEFKKDDGCTIIVQTVSAQKLGRIRRPFPANNYWYKWKRDGKCYIETFAPRSLSITTVLTHYIVNLA